MTQYFDVTELIGLRYNSGIQRVVREVAGRLAREGKPFAVAVVAIGPHFHPLSHEGHRVLLGQVDAARLAVPGGGGRVKDALRRFRPLFSLAQRTKFRRRLKAMRPLYDFEPVVPVAGDEIVLIDTLWSGSSALAAAQAAKRRGAKIALVVYDLFPISHPTLASRELAYVFPRVIKRALALADGVVTISRQATAELLAYAPFLDATRVSHAYLGHDFSQSALVPPADHPYVFPDGLWHGLGRTYLMVGTIEPRKGHDYVLDAFERLWAAGGDQTLLVIGKPGWHSDDLLARCAAHPQRGYRLFLIHDASDGLLREALRRSDALIMASSLEGFGLPLVEALSAGRPVLASDIAVFREIAGDAALFFRCGDAKAVVEAVRIFEAHPDAALARARAFSWPDWGAAAGGFAAAVTAVLGSAQMVQPDGTLRPTQ